MRSYKVKKEAYQLSRYTDRYPFTLLQWLANQYMTITFSYLLSYQLWGIVFVFCLVGLLSVQMFQPLNVIYRKILWYNIPE